MELYVSTSRLSGTVAIPGSKSHTIRAVAIASLASGVSVIREPLVSSDTLSAVDCYRLMGADIDTSDPRAWKVTGTSGNLKAPSGMIDVGNSGTTLRVAAGSAALCDGAVAFTGDEQICGRPIGPLLDAANALGAECRSINGNGKAPIEIGGKLVGGEVSLECVTSQYLTSLLLCTPLAERDSEIEVTLLNEPGYVQMTLDWLDKQGIEYDNQHLRHFSVKGGQSFKAFDAAIPADFSSATFFLCAAALVGDDVTLTGLDFTDSQPDKAVVDYLKAMGADIAIEADGVRIRRSQLVGAEIDMNATPDALPAIAVTAAFARGKTALVNVAQARNKETDRIKCMAAELTKMKIKVEELPDGIIIEGGLPRPAKFHGWADHRIVMATAVAAMAMQGQCSIDTAEAMSVTFPEYVDLMASLGANIEVK